MGGRISAQNWYQDKRSRLSGDVDHTRKILTSNLQAGKKDDDKLDISVFCRVLWSMHTDDCEVSVCAGDKPTKCYHVWQKLLYAPLPESLIRQGYPLAAPRRMIIPAKKSCEGILLGSDTYVSLYVNGKELSGNCDLDKKFAKGRGMILERICAELPKAKLSQRLISPQNKGKLLRYFSREFVESIKKDYSYGRLKIGLPLNLNRNV